MFYEDEEIAVCVNRLWLKRDHTGSVLQLTDHHVVGLFTNNIDEWMDVYYPDWTVNGYTI